MTFLRLSRTVARTSARCHFCPWVIQEFDSQYDKIIDGVSVGRYCSHDHAKKSTPIELEISYDA